MALPPSDQQGAPIRTRPEHAIGIESGKPWICQRERDPGASISHASIGEFGVDQGSRFAVRAVQRNLAWLGAQGADHRASSHRRWSR
jgi:hypothetical protein